MNKWKINQYKRVETHLLILFLILISVVMSCQGSVVVAMVREVKGRPIAVCWVERGHLQVFWLVQRLLSAAGVGARVGARQQRLHLPWLALPVQTRGSTVAGPAGTPALHHAVPGRLSGQQKHSNAHCLAQQPHRVMTGGPSSSEEWCQTTIYPKFHHFYVMNSRKVDLVMKFKVIILKLSF